MKILQNFLFVLKRFKTSSILNILGLSVAFAVFMIIMMQVKYDYNFDKFHENADQIYRIELTWEDGSKQAILSRPVGDALFKSSSHIKEAALVDPWVGNTFFEIEKDGSKVSYLEKIFNVYPSFVRLFHFDILEGNKNALEEPNKVLIPQSMAKKIFGDESSIDKKLGNYIVGGIYRDFPKNSFIENIIFARFGDYNLNNWGASNYYTYISLDSPEGIEDILQNFRDNLPESHQSLNLQFTPLTELHFTTDIQYDPTPKTSKQTLMVLFAIAIAIIIIAGINFTNFSMALAPMRIRSINTQKVLGASETEQKTMLILEALMMSVLAYLFALVLVYITSFTPVVELVDAKIALSSHLSLVFLTGAIALIVGIFAGLYPAVYLTSFQPAMVLSGSFGLSPKGRSLRNTLIGVQFVASFVLIISSLFMYLQNNHLNNVPLGFDRDHVIVSNMNYELDEKRDILTNELKSHAGIADVTYAWNLLSTSDQYMGWGAEYEGKEINHQTLVVEPSFLSIMGIEVTEGRDFRKDDEKMVHGKYIFNEAARREYGLKVNTLIDSSEIIGFIPDIHFTTFHATPTPMAFYVFGTKNWGNPMNFAYIKVAAGNDLREAVEFVKKTFSDLVPGFPFNVRLYDDALNDVYKKEQNLTFLITLFSAIAILISIIGVLGLVMFESEYRKKEIGIRKVLGSSISEILTLFSKTYILILGICFLIACPVVYFIMDRWLENFAYKTPLHWWVFLIGGLFVLIITLLIVNSQSYRAATENPTESLKGE